MDDLADLYPGYASHWIDTSAGRIFARVGGNGPPLLLLHGHPQSNVMWHRVAPALAERFTLVLADLPGYGWSAAPEAQEDHSPYTKRAMAAAMIEVMETLGHARFTLIGHDRGARVGYRLALDHPGRLARLAVLDIVTTWDMWHGMNARLAQRAWHWMFQSLPAPFPETLIGKDPSFYFDFRAAAGAKAKRVVFDPRALVHYHAAYQDPTRLHAICEDYRAGRTTDLAHDEADRAAGKSIDCPVLVLWGTSGLPGTVGMEPLTLWRPWARDLRGFAIDSGHYLAEENPQATAAALLDFLSER
jgi:haloacetate dehalogenase